MLVPLAAAVLAASAPVDEGVRQYEALQFERAMLVLKRAAADSSLSEPERARANLYLGLAAAQLLDERTAREAFARAVELDPAIRLPGGASPKVEAWFRQALDLAARRTVHLEVVLPSGAIAGDAVSLEVRAAPAERVDTVRLFSRRQGDEAFQAELLDPVGRGVFRGKVVARSPALEVYAEAEGDGAKRGRFAAADAPARIVVTERAAPLVASAQGPNGFGAGRIPPAEAPAATVPLWRRWWLYAGAAAVVAAVLVVVAVASQPQPCGVGAGQGCLWIEIDR